MSLAAPSHSSLPAASPAAASTTVAGARRRHVSPALLVASTAAALAAAGTYAAVAHHSGSTSAVPAASTPATRVLSTASLPGLVADGHVVVIHTPAAWSTTRFSAVATEPTARLQALGFTTAIVKQMHSARAGGVRWTSVAEGYATASGARLDATYQAAQLGRARHGTVSPFPVIGVPGARGISVTTARNATVAAVFAAGNYVYLVSARFPRPSVSPPARSQVSAAAGWLYLAVNGCVAPAHHAQAPVGAPAPATPASRPLGRI